MVAVSTPWLFLTMPQSTPRNATSSNSTVPTGMSTNAVSNAWPRPNWYRLSRNASLVAGSAAPAAYTTATAPIRTPAQAQPRRHVPGPRPRSCQDSPLRRATSRSHAAATGPSNRDACATRSSTTLTTTSVATTSKSRAMETILTQLSGRCLIR